MSNHQSHHTVHAALHMSEQLRPFTEEKDPMIAALCGFFAGGIGLGLYFKSFKDFALPVVLWVFCTLAAPITIGTSYIAAGCFCAAYGYRRAKASNAKLAEQWSGRNAPPVISAYLPPPESHFQTERIIDVAAVPRLVTPPPPISSSAPPPLPAFALIQERLTQLTALRDHRLISDADFETKKQEILNSL